MYIRDTLISFLFYSLLLCFLLASCSPTQQEATEPGLEQNADEMTRTAGTADAPTAVPSDTPTHEPSQTSSPTHLPPTATESQTPTDEPEEKQYLDFSLVEGKWSGEACDAECFWFELELKSGADVGGHIGTSRYGTDFDSMSNPDCIGALYAVRIEDQVYVAKESIVQGNCPNGILMFQYDPSSGVLDYQFEDTEFDIWDASGSATRDE